MTFLEQLNTIDELKTEPIGAQRTYWHFKIQKESEEEYALYWRNVCFIKCKNLRTCIDIFQGIYKMLKIEHDS